MLGWSQITRNPCTDCPIPRKVQVKRSILIFLPQYIHKKWTGSLYGRTGANKYETLFYVLGNACGNNCSYGDIYEKIGQINVTEEEAPEKGCAAVKRSKFVHTSSSENSDKEQQRFISLKTGDTDKDLTVTKLVLDGLNFDIAKVDVFVVMYDNDDLETSELVWEMNKGVGDIVVQDRMKFAKLMEEKPFICCSQQRPEMNAAFFSILLFLLRVATWFKSNIRIHKSFHSLKFVQHAFNLNEAAILILEDVFVITGTENLVHYIANQHFVKLHTCFSNILIDIFNVHKNIWLMFLFVIRHYLLHPMFHYIIFVGPFGFSFQIAMIYELAKLLNLQPFFIFLNISMLQKFWTRRIFPYGMICMGKPKGKHLKDFCIIYEPYDREDLFLISAWFAVLLFLFPTIALFYLLFLLMRCTLGLMQDIIGWIFDFFTVLSIYTIWAYYKTPRCFGGKVVSSKKRVFPKTTIYYVKIVPPDLSKAVKFSAPSNMINRKQITRKKIVREEFPEEPRGFIDCLIMYMHLNLCPAPEICDEPWRAS